MTICVFTYFNSQVVKVSDTGAIEVMPRGFIVKLGHGATTIYSLQDHELPLIESEEDKLVRQTDMIRKKQLMHSLTNVLLKIGVVIVAFGSLWLVIWLDQNLLRPASLLDVAKFYGVYFAIVIIGTIPVGIFLALFDRLLDEIFGY